jgi:hypothetical protein
MKGFHAFAVIACYNLSLGVDAVTPWIHFDAYRIAHLFPGIGQKNNLMIKELVQCRYGMLVAIDQDNYVYSRLFRYNGLHCIQSIDAGLAARANKRQNHILPDIGVKRLCDTMLHDLHIGQIVSNQQRIAYIFEKPSMTKVSRDRHFDFPPST